MYVNILSHIDLPPAYATIAEGRGTLLNHNPAYNVVNAEFGDRSSIYENPAYALDPTPQNATVTSTQPMTIVVRDLWLIHITIAVLSISLVIVDSNQSDVHVELPELDLNLNAWIWRNAIVQIFSTTLLWEGADCTILFVSVPWPLHTSIIAPWPLHYLHSIILSVYILYRWRWESSRNPSPIPALTIILYFLLLCSSSLGAVSSHWFLPFRLWSTHSWYMISHMEWACSCMCKQFRDFHLFGRYIILSEGP